MKTGLLSKGQAYSEFIVALAILVPLMMFLPTIANLLSAQTEAHKAARYVAWERTAYPVSAQKSDADLATEVETRFLVDPESGFGDQKSPFRRPWRDFGSADLDGKVIDFNGSGVAVVSEDPDSATAGLVNASARMAGVGGQNNADHAIQLDTKQKTRLSIPISSDNSLFQTTRITSVWFAERTPALDTPPPEDEIAGQSRFFVASSTSIVSDSWVSVNEGMFFDRVSGLTTGSRAALRAVELPGAQTLSLFGFEEIDQRLFRGEAASQAFEMVDDAQSMNLPQRLQEYE